MKDEIIESIFGCLERIEEKLDKQAVQSEQGESENSENFVEALMPLVDSMNYLFLFYRMMPLVTESCRISKMFWQILQLYVSLHRRNIGITRKEYN